MCRLVIWLRSCWYPRSGVPSGSGFTYPFLVVFSSSCSGAMEICRRGDINLCQLSESTGTEDCFEDVFLFFSCVYLCVGVFTWVQMPAEARKCYGIPLAGARGIVSALSGPGNSSGLLREQHTIITAEPSPQPQKIVLYKWQEMLGRFL